MKKMKKFKNKKYIFSLNISIISLFFCSIFLCMVVFGVKKNFFFLESLYHSLNVSNKDEKDEKFFKSYWISVLAFKNQDKMYVFFDDGNYFVMGGELGDYMNKRTKDIVYLSSVMLKNDPSISSLSIMLSKDISYKDVRLLMNTFSKFGFRNFKFNSY